MSKPKKEMSRREFVIIMAAGAAGTVATSLVAILPVCCNNSPWPGKDS